MLMSFIFAAKLFFFGLCLWMGAYLLARNSPKATLRLTGLGLAAFALVLAGEILYAQVFPALVLLPALCWIGAALHLMPEEKPVRKLLIRLWAWASLPLFLLTLLNAWAASLVVAALLGCAGLVAWLARQAYFRNTLAVMAAVATFFAVSTGMLVLPVRFIPSPWWILLLGCDLLFLGLVIIFWDAFDDGATLRMHLFRSFLSSFAYAGTLALLVILVSALTGEFGQGQAWMLTSLVAFGILTQAFSSQIQKLLDLAAFPQAVEMNRQREILHQTAEEMPRLSPVNPLSVPEAEFIRLTRRAISSLGDLPRLSTSPLMHLPQLREIANPLERAQQLKALLVGQIQHLKPQQAAAFGATDEWRYYNALYFPYVAGLKPYARYPEKDRLDAACLQALEWFQTSVPERTLHNWQNSATQLVAQGLRPPP